MKRVLMFILALVMTLCIIMTTVAEQNQDSREEKTAVTAIVATKSSPLSLRDTPNQSGMILCEIPKGETITVLENGDWPKVEYKGKVGFVNGKYLQYQETIAFSTDHQDITGLWTAPVNGSTATLEIDANGTCELIVVTVDKATWTLEEQTLRLTQGGDSIYGTYDGKTIKLDFFGKLLAFTRKSNNEETKVESTSSSSDTQSIIGTWSVPTKNSSIILEFSADGTCELITGGTNKATWSLNGQQLTIKNRNGQILKGTYDGNTIILSINGSQLCFRR